MAALVGKWEYVSAENLDEYMAAAAVPENLRELAKNSKPEVEISNEGATWTMKTVISDKAKEITFTIGEEFDTQALTGQQIKCTVVLEGEKMVETQRIDDLSITISREVVAGQLVTKMTVGDTTATVTFKKA